MNSDAELDTAVAKKLGWDKREESGMPCTILNYSGSIEAAWEIVEHLKQFPNYWIAIRYKPISETENGGKYNFMIATNREGPLAESIANTAPRAICEAFLKLD